MHLLDAYSRTTGLRIDEMHLMTHFYPLGIDQPYIVVVTSTGAPAKNYSYFRLAIEKLRRPLLQKGVKIVQLGNQDDERIGADVDACGKTTTFQYFDIISRAELVLCGDTSALHVAGHFNRKIVSLFSISHPKISGAYFGKEENQVYLTPSSDWRPSFNPNENPKTIDQIMPERIVGAVSKFLDLEGTPFETVHIGSEFRVTMLESIPDAVVRPDFYPEAPLNLRLDKGGEEGFVYEQLRYRKSVIVTDKPLNLPLLHQLRGNVAGIIYLVTENDDPKFLEALHRNAFPYRLVSLLPENVVRDKKLSYADFNLLERKDPLTKDSVKLLGDISANTRFSSNKRILSNNKAYLSYAHLEQQKPLDNFTQGEDNVIDIPSFWEDSVFYHIFNNHG